MDYGILYLGSNVNVLLGHTWEMMGKLKKFWSFIQLRMANQHKIISIRKSTTVPVNIDGVCSVVEFEVNEIVDNNQPYPYFLGMDRSFRNLVVINLKKREMIFQGRGLKVTAPLDSMKERRYMEPIRK
jgi:hypothetical protein